MYDTRRDPVIHATPIAALRPTQMTVGLQEVERKRREWRGMGDGGKAHALERHMIPVVLGPGGERYLTDHHHLARALHDDGQKEAFVTVIGDLSKADRAHFWTLMDYHGWTHPFDEKGRRCDYRDLPRTVEGLRDDPYRSLAGALRRAGGFAKDATPFSEFVWADFFRLRLKRKALVQDFDAALKRAYALAKSADADYLPGWCGPHDDGPKSAGAKKGRRASG
jgi:hypothetical protein